jgi:hypothetical protein
VPPVNVATNGCGTGVAGVVSQGTDWHCANVVAFYPAKLNPAQQNYPVHEIEMLAGVETMLRHQDLLQGVKFKWYTDHKGLIHFLEQKNLLGWQACWLEKLSEFDFEVVYVPGVENILSDILLRLYSNDRPGTVCACSEYTYHNVIDNDILGTHLISMLVLFRLEGESTGVPAPVNSLLLNDAVALLSTGSQLVAGPLHPRGCCVVESAKTGHPETGKEFAARMKNHFILWGPKEQKEGEGAQSTPQKLTIKLPAHVQQADIQCLPNTVIPNDGFVNQSAVEQLPNQEQLLDQAISDCS